MCWVMSQRAFGGLIADAWQGGSIFGGVLLAGLRHGHGEWRALRAESRQIEPAMKGAVLAGIGSHGQRQAELKEPEEFNGGAHAVRASVQVT